ncbi:MAG TPA: diadenylate cyclase CdaA [Clostridia bacterium]|nr:diadenylate cyclase CdaA [Clostridia bacterium]
MNFWDSLISFWEKISSVFLSFRVPDILDIILVAFVLYNILKLVRETRAIQLLKGLALLGVLYFVILTLNMQASSYVFQRLFNDIIIVLIILFQPEIRHAIESVGRSKLTSLNMSFFGKSSEIEKREELMKKAIVEVCRAIADMSEKKIGAIIVFERETLLGDVISTGTMVDAQITKELIGNIFYPKSPLHDGASILRGDRLLAAGCILPLTQDNKISRELGTRHRSGIGVTEQSDAVVAIVSEETGAISFAQKGMLVRGITDSMLREKLILHLLPNDDNKNGDEKTHRIRNIFGRFKNE